MSGCSEGAPGPERGTGRVGRLGGVADRAVGCDHLGVVFGRAGSVFAGVVLAAALSVAALTSIAVIVVARAVSRDEM